MARPLNKEGRRVQAEHFRRAGDKETAAAIERGDIDFDPEYLECDPTASSPWDIHGSHPPQQRRR